MSEPTESPGRVSPRAQPYVSGADTLAAESTIVHSSSATSTTHDNELPDFFKPGHVVQIPLRSLQDVTRARDWIQSIKSQARPILSDLEFPFRALYDGVEAIIRVVRIPRSHDPHTDPETELAACLRLHSQDFRIPARALNMYNEVTKDGGVWIAHHWTDETQNLRIGGHIWRRYYYPLFKSIALRTEGKEWGGAELESVGEFLADIRGR